MTRTLERVPKYQPGPPDKIPAKSLQGHKRQLSRRTHPAANLLSRVLTVRSVSTKVVCSGRQCPEVSVPARIQRFIALKLFRQRLKAWSHTRLSSFQLKFLYQLLDLPRVRLVLEPVIAPSNDSIQTSRFSIVIPARAKPPTSLKFLLGFKGGLVPIQALLRHNCREVIAMGTANDVLLRVREMKGTQRPGGNPSQLRYSSNRFAIPLRPSESHTYVFAIARITQSHCLGPQLATEHKLAHRDLSEH